MNEFTQDRILSMIDRELTIDQIIRAQIEAFIQVLPTNKKMNLNLSLEIIQNRNLKNLLEKIMEEIGSKKISNHDDSALASLVQNRLDEITDFNLQTLPENQQNEIKMNLDILNKASKNIDKTKY